MNRNDELSNKRLNILLISFLMIIIFLVGFILIFISDAYVNSEPWRTLLNILGGFMSISVAASYLYEITIKRIDDLKRRRELAEVVKECTNQTISNSHSYGFVGFNNKLDFKNLFDRLDNNDELLWLDTYAPGHQHWISNMENALLNGAYIKMFVINWQCDNTMHRADELPERYSRNTVKREVEIFYNEMVALASKPSIMGKLEVKLYKDLPGIPMYIVVQNTVPQYAYTSYFLTQATGINFPHLKWEYTQSGMINHLYDHFMAKWKNNSK